MWEAEGDCAVRERRGHNVVREIRCGGTRAEGDGVGRDSGFSDFSLGISAKALKRYQKNQKICCTWIASRIGANF